MLINISDSVSRSWMVRGDFNVVRSTEECHGSIPSSLPSREFGEMIMDCALFDLPFMGFLYTWFKSSSTLFGSVWTVLRLTQVGMISFLLLNWSI